MGSGKSIIAKRVTMTEFYKKYGKHVVCMYSFYACLILSPDVSADELKMNDPVYQALNGKDSSASMIVHNYSTKAAEELLLAAVQMGRGTHQLCLN